MADICRLRPGQEALAREVFRVMAAVFEEEADVAALLRLGSFWAFAALEEGAVVGGVTAHALPMTRSRATELFIYDLAVRADRQRRGIGRALVAALLEQSRAAGLRTAFVPADNEDTHALDFYRALGGVASPVTFFTFEGGLRRSMGGEGEIG